MKWLSVLIALAWSACAGSAAAQELWRGAAAGMIRAEVEALFPAAAPETIAGTEVLKLGGLTLEGQPWTASFQFHDGQLGEVILHPADTVSGPGRGLMFAGVRRDLIAKYGPPLDCNETLLAGRTVRTSYCSWSTAAIKIDLKLTDIGGDLHLSVTYSAEMAGESIL